MKHATEEVEETETTHGSFQMVPCFFTSSAIDLLHVVFGLANIERREITQQHSSRVAQTQPYYTMPEDLGNVRLYKHYKTISFSSHPSKIMLRVILNRLKGKVEDTLPEEQVGFRARRSTTEQIFNARLILEKHLLHQKDLTHNFIDFKKAFDRI